jgi:RNA polymerase sigma factor (sigma-70 family)
MTTKGLRKTIEHLRQVLSPAEMTDEQLLKAFISARDETAFAKLLRRHGPMVLGVCRRVLGNLHDSEDAFQATFLVLARKARSLVSGKALSSWLYTVAFRISLEARAGADRRRKRERQVEVMPHPEIAPSEPKDWQPVLDQELSRLPEKYRVTVILCDLEGRTRKDVARQLGLAEGTLSSRLATARRMLAKSLTRHGLTLSGGALAVAISSASAAAGLPPSLIGVTAKAAHLAAAGHLVGISTSVLALMKGAMKIMLIAKLKATIATLMVLAAVGAGSLIVFGGNGHAQAPASKTPTELELLRKENELLKLNLRVTLEKIQNLESTVAALKDGTKGGKGPKVTILKEKLIGNAFADFNVDGKPDVIIFGKSDSKPGANGGNDLKTRMLKEKIIGKADKGGRLAIQVIGVDDVGKALRLLEKALREAEGQGSKEKLLLQIQEMLKERAGTADKNRLTK